MSNKAVKAVETSEDIKVGDHCNIDLNDIHVKVIIKALEVYYRLKSGQIKMALDTAYSYRVHPDKTQEIEDSLKDFLPEKLAKNSYFGFSSPQIGDARVAYEIEKILEEYISVKENDGFWDFSTNFHGPLKSSKEPYPVIRNFKKYKDYTLPLELTDRIKNLEKLKNYPKIWQLVDIHVKLPKNEKAEIKLSKDEDRYFVRCHKPRNSKY